MIFIYDVTTSMIAIVEELHERSEHFPIDNELRIQTLSEFTADKKEAHEHLTRLETEFSDIIKFVTTKRFPCPCLT